MGYVWLAFSLMTAILANVFVKTAYGFTNRASTALAFLCYGWCAYFLVLTVSYMELGALYGIWAGLTVSGTALIGMNFLNERRSKRKVLSIALIIFGVVLLQL
ncbi:multidrug efflux SMR transporter [Geomicrobium sp. JSM 1781026]|uniref:DMT family transporter n=1 Tax=Geomicrobium sp. JSM 1781026 TaxID=3344580 RepID=UPI0035C0C5A4